MKDKRRIAIFSIYFVTFLDGVGFAVIIPLITPMFFNQQLGIFGSDVSHFFRSISYGLMIASYCLAMFFATPIFGALSDEFERKPILKICLLGTALGYAISGIVYPYRIPENLPKNCFFKMFKMFGKKLRWHHRFSIYLFIKEKHNYDYESYQFHQKYVAVDNSIGILGCVDIDKKRTGDEAQHKGNIDGYVWSEIAVKFVCDDKFWLFCQENFNTLGCAQTTHPWYGSFEKINTEHKKIIELIQSAENEVYIENQYFFGRNCMRHAIIRTLLEKIVDSIRKDSDFKVIVVTNHEYVDSPYLMAAALKRMLYHTLIDIEKYFIKKNIPLSKLYERLLLGYIQHENLPVFIHSKIIIIDRQKALVSTSNITDLSLIEMQSDRELALVVEGQPKKVVELFEKLVTLHLNIDVNQVSFATLFAELQQDRHGFKKLPQNLLQSRWQRIRYLIDDYLFLQSLNQY
jgi:hypothetical protein